jgi:cobalt/nickel transport system permease protein
MSGYHPRTRGGFLENTLEGLRDAMERAMYAETWAARKGALQRLDPRVKVAGFLALALSAASAARLAVIAAILILALSLAAVAAIPLRVLASRTWLGALLFSGAIAVPAMFLTPGTPLAGWPITLQGVRAGSFLILRAETAATLLLVLVYTTPWTHILKALRILRVPVLFVVILGMTCRYILLLLETAHQMFESRRSRAVNRMTPAESRRLAISASGALLNKTVHLSSEVYLAMQARGFRGEVYLMDDFEMRRGDWLASIAFATLAAVCVVAGR